MVLICIFSVTNDISYLSFYVSLCVWRNLFTFFHCFQNELSFMAFTFKSSFDILDTWLQYIFCKYHFLFFPVVYDCFFLEFSIPTFSFVTYGFHVNIKQIFEEKYDWWMNEGNFKLFLRNVFYFFPSPTNFIIPYRNLGMIKKR